MKQCSHVRGYAAQFRGGGGMVGSKVYQFAALQSKVNTLV